MSQQDLVEVNGNYEKAKLFFGTPGGALMQLYLILVGIFETQHPE